MLTLADFIKPLCSPFEGVFQLHLGFNAYTARTTEMSRRICRPGRADPMCGTRRAAPLHPTPDATETTYVPSELHYDCSDGTMQSWESRSPFATSLRRFVTSSRAAPRA